MSTQSWSTRVRHDSDAVYQEWRDELVTKLNALVTAGVLGADETNITAGAGSRPASNTEGGYAVYHIADSLHGSAPIYLRFGFGTNNTTTAPRIQITTGTSTNGSGVLGGTALSTIATINSNTASATDTPFQSYMCASDGFFGLAWKVATSGAPNGCFFIARTVDSSGAITATGAIAYWGTGSATGITKTQAFRFPATAVAYTAQTTPSTAALCLNPQLLTNTLVGSDNQFFPAWTITPGVSVILGIVGVLATEISVGNTFSGTVIGSTAHTYLALSNETGPIGPNAASSTGGLKIAMLWE